MYISSYEAKLAKFIFSGYRRTIVFVPLVAGYTN